MLLIAIILTFTISPVSNASASSHTDKAIKITPEDNSLVLQDEYDFENLQIMETDGSILTFESTEDMSSYISSHLNGSTTMALGETLVGTQIKKMQFISYSNSTKEWTKASKYTLSKSSKIGITGKVPTKWGDISVSFTRKYDVATTIPADSKKFSKLAGYSDLKIQRYKVSRPNMHNSYHVTKTTKTQNYIKVKYK